MIHTLAKQLVVLVVVGAWALGVDLLLVSAQTAEELKQKISAKTDEIARIEAEIKQYQKDIEGLGTQKTSLKNSIAQLNLTRKKLEADIKITQTKIDATDLRIRQLGSQIIYKENEIDSRNAALKEALRGIAERDQYSLPAIALSNESFSGLWDDLEAMDQFTGAVNKNIDLLKGLKTDLEDKQDVQEAQKKELAELKDELNDRKKIVEQNNRTQAKLLKDTSNQESTYKKILSQKVALKDAFEKELRDYESTLKFILDPTSIPPRGTKVFSSPLAPAFVTQQFGRTSSSGRLYASGTHNGTDFRASVGTPVKAMLSGTVMGTGDTDLACPGASYGRWVLIRHNNGLASLYAHFSLIKVSAGQEVSTGEVIGYSGNTGYSTGPHLHLTVFAAAAVNIQKLPSKACGGRMYTMPVAALNAYLDPMDYL